MNWIARLCVTALLVALSVLVFKVVDHVFPELLHGEPAVADDRWHPIPVRAPSKQTADEGTKPALLDESLNAPLTPAPSAAVATAEVLVPASAAAASQPETATVSGAPAPSSGLKPLPLSPLSTGTAASTPR